MRQFVRFTELIESTDSPVGSLPDMTPLESSSRLQAQDYLDRA